MRVSETFTCFSAAMRHIFRRIFNMKKLILLTLCVLLLISFCSCQNAFAEDETVLWREVERIEYVYATHNIISPIAQEIFHSVTEYDEAGRKSKFTYYNEDGSWSSGQVYIYNEDGTLARIDYLLNSAGEVWQCVFYSYEYHDNGNMKKQTVVQGKPDGTVTFTLETKNYDEDGNWIKTEKDKIYERLAESEKENPKFVYEYEYDEYGNVIREDWYVNTFTTDENGEVVPSGRYKAYSFEYKWEKVEK